MMNQTMMAATTILPANPLQEEAVVVMMLNHMHLPLHTCQTILAALPWPLLCHNAKAPFNTHTHTIVVVIESSLVRWKTLRGAAVGSDDVIGARVAFVGFVAKDEVRITGRMMVG